MFIDNVSEVILLMGDCYLFQDVMFFYVEWYYYQNNVFYGI